MARSEEMQGEIRFLLFNHGSISDATDIEKHECVFDENLSFNMVGLPLSLLNWIEVLILSQSLKLLRRKSEPWFIA